MFSLQHRKVRALFGLSDVLLTTLAFVLAYETRFHLNLAREFYLTTAEKALLLGSASILYLGLGLWFQVYDRLDPGNPRVILRDVFRQCLLGAAGVVLFQYVLRLDLSRFFLALFGAYSLVLIVLFRLSSGKLVGLIRSELNAPRYVVVVGLDDRARRLASDLEAAAKYGVRLMGFVADIPGPAPKEIQLVSTYPVHPLEHLPELLSGHVIDEVLFGIDSERLAELEEVFLLCDEEGVRTRVAVDFFPHVNSKIYLDSLGRTPLLTFSATPHDEIRLMLKRLIDIVVSSAGLAVLWPFMLAVALVVRLTSPGPAIFRQIRCGLNGRRFVMYKFRSMRNDADQLRKDLEHLSSKKTAFKLRDDPRLTSIGRWLRKFSIDELPQLWNVLRGDMSLVGPRPAVESEVGRYERWQRRRLRMRPGLTCLWTLAGRDEVEFDDWMRMDMQYIDSWSLGLDWRILLETIPRVLSGKGAY